MTRPDRETIRRLLLHALSGGVPVSRAALLDAAARELGIEARKRSLRALVSGELRTLVDEGRVVDGGPVVWLGRP
jgi:hypothetical protein